MTKAEEEAKRELQQEQDDIRGVMGTPAGRRFMWRVLARAGVFHKCYTGNSETFYNEGRRDYGLWLYGQVMEACPELYAEAVRELHDISKKQKKERTS